MSRNLPMADVDGMRTMAVAGAVLGAAIAGSLHLALDAHQARDTPDAFATFAAPAAPVRPAHPPPPSALEVSDRPATTRPGTAAHDHAADPPRKPPTPPATAHEPPYRFLGRTGTGSETALVLFGRGRVVTVRGPGPLDAEHTLEHMADDHLLVRHLPSGVGRIVPLVLRRPAVDPAQDDQGSEAD